MEKTVKEIRNDLLGPRVVKALEERNFEAYYCPDRKKALETILGLMPEGSSVSWGGSETIRAIGLTEAVINGSYEVIDRDKASSVEERTELMRKALLTDFYLLSANAISKDGILVNIDGNGNRVAALCFGPKNVIVVAGMNKIASDCNAAVDRARSYASPVNQLRFQGKTPCTVTGACSNCKSDDCICSQIVVTRMCKPKGRIKVVLIGEDNLGF